MPDTNAPPAADQPPAPAPAPPVANQPPPPVWRTAWDWYWQHFLKGVCFHLPLVLLLVALFILPFNVFGEEFGVIQLVWHEHWWKRALVGAAMGVVGLEALFIGYILWFRAGNEGRLRVRGTFRPISFDWFVARTLGCLFLTLLILFVLWKGVELTDTFGKAVGPEATEEARKRVLIAKTPDDPRRAWVAAADPDPTADPVDRLFLVAALPLGALSVGGAIWLGGRCGLGSRAARLRLMQRGRTNLARLDEEMRRLDRPGWTWWQVGGIVVVTLAWLAALVASLGREAWEALLTFASAGLVIFGVAIWRDHKEVAAERRWVGPAFLANIITHAVLAFIWVTFCLSAYGWWAGLLAALSAGMVAVALAVAMPGPAGEWLALCRQAPAPATPAATPVPVAAPLRTDIPPDKIAARAYEIWVRKGKPDGLDLQNWSEAEAELRAEFAQHSPKPAEKERSWADRFRGFRWSLIAPPEPIPDAFQMWPFVVLVGLVFFLLCNIPAWASPAPVVCFFLFGLVLAYGAATVVIRRAIPIAVTGLVFFAILAGIQPYKFRYDGYQTDEGGWVEGLPYNEPADLRDLARKDQHRQGEFDKALKRYEPARDQYRLLEQKYSTNEAIRQSVDWYGVGPIVVPYLPPTSGVTFDTWSDAWQKFPDLRRELAAARTEFEAQTENVRARWRDMEHNNRVIAARHARPDLDLDFLNERDPRPDHKDQLLLPTEWTLETVPKEQPLVVIAVSGGGLRSAAWTFTVLRALEERFAAKGIDFPAYVRIITGASGGMLGAAYYVATLPTCRPVKDPGYLVNRKKQLDDLYTDLTRDDLTAMVKQQVYEDVPNLFSPWPARHDRGKELERVWSRNLRGALDIPIGQLRADEKAGRRPSLVFTPMMIEDGRRLIVSNLDLRHAITHEGNLLLEEPGAPKPSAAVLTGESDPYGVECHSREAIELFRLFPGAAAQVRLSTAVRMSASFPFFSPAVSLPVTPRRRIVDAGYYDNYGVSLAASWLTNANNRSWIRAHATKILLIQIRDGVDQPWRRLDQVEVDSSSGPSRSTEELSSPLEGLYNARVASSSFRNDNQLQLLNSFWTEFLGVSEKSPKRPDQQNRVFQVVNFELPERAALSWYLSTSERERVRGAMGTQAGADQKPLAVAYQKRLGKILAWWNSPFKFQR